MIKRLLVLAAVLLAALSWAGCAPADEARTQDLKIQMSFSEVNVSAGDTIRVTISVTNVSGRDFAEGMTLYDPLGLQIRDFGHPVLKDGETASWSGRWVVMEKNLNEKKITFVVRYAVEIDGELVKKKVNIGRGITPVIPEVTPEPEPTPAPKPEDFDDVVLYGVYRPNPSTGWVSVGCVDRGGNVWLAEKADVRWPALDEDVRDMLRVRRGMKKYENLIGYERRLVLLGRAGHGGRDTPPGGKAPEDRHRRRPGSGLGPPEERQRRRGISSAGHGRQLSV